jgi:hypothetical protein
LLWQERRDSQFFVLGSKDESGGCQGCVMTHVGDNRFALRLRLNGKDKRYIRLDVSFAYGLDHLLAALKNKQAMSYRFLLDDKGWRVFVSTAVPPTRRRYCIGTPWPPIPLLPAPKPPSR